MWYPDLADIERGLVRVLHSLSFVDDPTRLLRAVRYEQRYGFEIESRTRQLMDEARPMLEKLSPERVRHELDRMLDEPNWCEMLLRLDDLGLLDAIHPELSPPDSRFQAPARTTKRALGGQRAAHQPVVINERCIFRITGNGSKGWL